MGHDQPTGVLGAAVGAAKLSNSVAREAWVLWSGTRTFAGKGTLTLLKTDLLGCRTADHSEVGFTTMRIGSFDRRGSR